MKEPRVLDRSAGRRYAGRLTIIAAAIALAMPLQGLAASKTFTLDADFDLGVLDNVNHTAIHNQLQLNVIGNAFPVLWIANAGEDTVSKFDTVTNRELARYRTWFGPAGQPGYFNHINNAYDGAAPSRTAVDIHGNAYVANRHFDGRRPDVLKILNDGGIDRNGNGTIDTSSDTSGDGLIQPGEMLPMADTNGNSIIDASEIRDERVAWAVQVGPPNGLGRSMCIGTDGNLWVGMYNASQYYKISSADGSVLAGPVGIGITPYGCLVDANGILWSASLSNQLGKLNTSTLATATFAHPGSDYGIALGNDKVYQANYAGLSYTQFDPATNLFTTPAAVKFSAYGIATDGSGNIIVGNVNGGVTKYSPTGAVIWQAPAQAGTGEVRGVQIDGNNDVWLIHRTSNNISKHRGTDGGALGVFPVGNQPYTYSDASGFAVRNITTETGTWTVITDGGVAGTQWTQVGWNASVPTGALVGVTVRAADNAADLPLQSYQAVGNNVPFSKTGRYLQVQTRLTASLTKESPQLFDLTVMSSAAGSVCDIDADGDVDTIDLGMIRAAIGQTPTVNDPRDANVDGKITINDVRYCTLRCTRTSCATN